MYRHVYLMYMLVGGTSIFNVYFGGGTSTFYVYFGGGDVPLENVYIKLMYTFNVYLT